MYMYTIHTHIYKNKKPARVHIFLVTLYRHYGVFFLLLLLIDLRFYLLRLHVVIFSYLHQSIIIDN